MKTLSYILLFFYSCFLQAFPPITQNAIPLSEELKLYLEQRCKENTEKKEPISEDVLSFDISMVGDLENSVKWRNKCWRLSQAELEDILYKFYVYGECVNEENTIRFLDFCLDCYLHMRENTKFSLLELKSYSILYREQKRINQISRELWRKTSVQEKINVNRY